VPNPSSGKIETDVVGLSVLSAVVSERFVNFLPNFAPQFPEKDVEEARDRCRIDGIGFEFFVIPMNFPAIPVSARLRKDRTLYCRCG
jgi:hypothetical protein